MDCNDLYKYLACCGFKITLPYLRNENVPQLCDLVVVWASFLLTFILVRFEAVEEALVEGEQALHPKEESLQPGLLHQQRLPQLVHVDSEKDF